MKICCITCIFLCALSISFESMAQYRQLEFVENRGQWKNAIRYQATTGSQEIYLLNDGFYYVLNDSENINKLDAFHHGNAKTPPVLKFHAYKVTFLGARKPDIVGGNQYNVYYNYFLGNDSSKWKTGIHPDRTLDYNNLYRGINMHVTSSDGNMEYEFDVSPGADPSLIKLQFTGADDMHLKDGNLVISTSTGQVQEIKPYAYQYINGSRVEVKCRYKLTNNVLHYYFPQDYNTTQNLIIDPTVVFCSFTGSSADNWGFTATYDNDGNFYGGGLVNTLYFHGSFPVTTGAFQDTFGGGDYINGSAYACDIAIAKFSSDGSSLIYATYLGGSSNEQPHSLIVDTNNNLIVVGRSYSTDFPTTSGSFSPKANGGADIIVTKLNASGTALIASTYVGGKGDDVVNYDAIESNFGNLKHNYGDDARSEVEIDKAGNVYVAACTKSSDFPVTSNAYQKSIASTQDGVFFKLSADLSKMIYSTYIGGDSDDAAYVVALDTQQAHVFIAGGTQSADFPATSGAYLSAYQGGSADGFIAKFLNSGTYALQASTLIGTSNYDQCYGIQIDNNNAVYAMGQTLGGSAFPVSSGVYSDPHSSQFVIKLDSNLSTRVYSTVFGSGDSTHTNISPVAFLVDTCENVYISGWGGNLYFNTPGTGTVRGMPVTPATALKSTTDGYDFYFIVFSKDVKSLLYGSYFGRTCTDSGKGEHVDGGTSRFDKNGVIYQGICGGCYGLGIGTTTPFPTTAGAYATTDGSPNCNFAALKIKFDLSAVKAMASARPSVKGCAPFAVNFHDSSVNATNYSWTFGDGSTDTAFSPTHTFTAAGTYKVRLVAYNTSACKEYDTAYVTITIDTTSIYPSFTYATLDSCTSYTVSFTNTSVYSSTPGSSGFTRFLWLFGDSTSYSGVTPPVHTYPGKGTYTVSLIMIDSTSCNSPDTVTKTFGFNNVNLAAKFGGPDTICKSSTANFIDSSVNATTATWFYGDGQTGNSAVHEYDSVGTFTVTLVITNPSSCKGSDTFSKSITVVPLPTAAFSFVPIVPETNVPTTFTNESVNAISYAWDFGDGSASIVVNPVHQYKRTGTYNVCLTSIGIHSCIAKVCQSVSSDIRPLADVPTAFSPNGDGANDVLYVRGGAIQSLDFKVYNRWGQVVFETKDMSIGWDGKFNGQPQPMDAYAFVLNVSFIDGTTYSKKGSVTLLR